MKCSLPCPARTARRDAASLAAGVITEIAPRAPSLASPPHNTGDWKKERDAFCLQDLVGPSTHITH